MHSGLNFNRRFLSCCVLIGLLMCGNASATTLLAIGADGNVTGYVPDAQNGTLRQLKGTYAVGWDKYDEIVPLSENVLLALKANKRWDRFSYKVTPDFVYFEEPVEFGKGWSYKNMFSNGRDLLFGVRDVNGNPDSGNGELYCWRYSINSDGGVEMLSMGSLGAGWGEFKHIVHGAGNTILAINSAGDRHLLRYEYSIFGGKVTSVRGPKDLSKGWTYREIVQGYGNTFYGILERPNENANILRFGPYGKQMPSSAEISKYIARFVALPDNNFATEDLIQAIRDLADAEKHVMDAPRKNALGKFHIQNDFYDHVNGMARMGKWWITGYPSGTTKQVKVRLKDVRQEGRIFCWNEDKDDYEEPIIFRTQGNDQEEGYPAGMDSAQGEGGGSVLAVACATRTIRFYGFDYGMSGNIIEFPSFIAEKNQSSVGIAYRPEWKDYVMVLSDDVYVGRPEVENSWKKLGSTDYARGPEESLPLVNLGRDRYAVFCPNPSEDTPYTLGFCIFSVSGNEVKVIHKSERVKLTHDGPGGAAPSFRWAGTVNYEKGRFTLYAAPKRLDASGDFFYWKSEVGM